MTALLIVIGLFLVASSWWASVSTGGSEEQGSQSRRAKGSLRLGNRTRADTWGGPGS